MDDANNVVPFTPTVQHKKREPALTDAELVALRRMMVQFSEVSTTCPAAMRVLRDAGLR